MAMNRLTALAHRLPRSAAISARFSSQSAEAPAEDSASPTRVSKPRVASTLGNINIPSRDEIKLNRKEAFADVFVPPKDGEEYKPDLTYLQRRGGLAGRLAKQLRGEQTPETTGQNRERHQKPHPRMQSDGVRNARAQPRNNDENRRRSKVHTAKDNQQRPPPIQRQQQPTRVQREPRERKPRGVTAAHTSRSIPVDDDLASRKGDIDFAVVEAGGELPAPPRFTNPQAPSADLSDIFGPPQLDLQSTLQKIPSIPLQIKTQRIKENLGGDYARYSSQSPKDHVIPPHKRGPLKEVSLALSRSKDVDLNQRSLVSKIVTTSVAN